MQKLKIKTKMKRYNTKKRRQEKTKWFTLFIITLVAVVTIQVFKNGVLTELGLNRYYLTYKAEKTLKTPEIGLTEGVIREVTAYNAGDIAQTDSSPCISANGENICLALELGYKRCAANFVPIGTDLYIQNYGECKVTDRMNSRYKNRVDIAMMVDEKERAIKFGLQNLIVREIK